MNFQKKLHIPIPGCISDSEHNSVNPEEDLLTPLKIRGLTLRNRIVVSPMCQYSSTDGGKH